MLYRMHKASKYLPRKLKSLVLCAEAPIEVAVAPGGRWSRFKTYSMIQRTLEIWGFVITFIFKSWLNYRKFSNKGLLFGFSV
ncbi:hypothetical protein PHAVU_002G315800 [Phaseolus vulgaris]|uniref:Uncharacterized protein n=1 Tax=Phaseolus vulgaris TaxID=3885 RepID=V7CSM1_PHAVU|nr:hypothetical protein PHAVU_002G315800g [Phaseolus vulgaris]ESW32363.1 hypothetical protein PHAVU_002G315800g [Phaseolus vulgaris]